MDKIPLRTYLKEIEKLIDKGENDQAIAHCRHILKAYPKNLATYRLLGKAYLECHRYGDAADVFQRVLSGAPDDFVSHVGMSIIREDESNQDAAIWHMERAFEIQPYNSAIQDELRRLYGRRDGLEPPKVRLTRGALARMYARGNLYQQAIGELRAALAEDPKRSDLQVLLARMYFMAGQKVEAVETCSTLLKKLPYCLEANRIISAILPETERKEETQVYRERVMSLDPYLVLASPYETTSDGVRDQVVVIEKLDYQEGQSDESAQPAWAASLGVTFEEFKSGEEPIPDWLQAFSDGQVGPPAPSKSMSTGQVSPEEPPSEEASFLSEDTELIPGTEGEDELPSWISFPDQPSGKGTPPASGEIPEWMKEAGWEASTGAVESGLPAFEYPETEEIDEPEIEKGELPSWLQSLAPSEMDASSPLSDEDALLASMPWLKESGSESEQQLQGSEAAPDWLEELGAEPKQAAPEAPEWLIELDEAADTVGEAAAKAEGAGRIDAAKDELLSEPFEDVADEIQSQGDMQEPAAFSFEEAESLKSETGEEALPGKAEAEEELPEWLKEVNGEAGSGEPAELGAEALEAEAGQEASDLAAGVPSEVIFSQETETVEGLPDWLKEEDQEEVEKQAHTPLASIEGEPVDDEIEWVEASGIDLPESNRSLDVTEGEPDLTGALEEKDALLDELESVSPAGVEEGEALFSEMQFEAGEAEGGELPDWVRELEAEQPDESLVTAEDSAPAIEKTAPGGDLPEWMQEIIQEGSAGPIEESEIEEEKDFEGIEASEEVPDWLREFDKVGESKLDEIQIDELDTDELLEEGSVPGVDIPAWLRDMEEETLELSEASVDRPPAPEIPPQSEKKETIDDELDWLQIIGEKPLSGESNFEGVSGMGEPVYSPEDLDALLADTQPVRVGREESAEPFNEILEEIDSGLQTPETGEVQESPAEHEEFADESIDEFEGAVPGVFGAALAAVDDEGILPDEDLMQAEVEQVLHSTEDASPLPTFEVDDQDAGMAWLESLAAKHGISEEELFTSPKERPEAFPFDDITEGNEGAEPRPGSGPTEELEVIEADIEVPEQVEQKERESEENIESMEEAALVESEQAESEEAPDWLKELEGEDQEPLELETELSAFAETVDADSTYDQAEVGPAEELSVEEVPDWLREVQSEAEEELSQRQPETGSGQEYEAEDNDAAMAWLESLAAKQGVPEDELFTRPEDRLDTPPVWVEEAETDVSEGVPLPVEVGTGESRFEPEELGELLFETPELEEMAQLDEQVEVEVGVVQEADEVGEITTSQPVKTEEPELPDWLSESGEAEGEDVEWAMPVEPVKAALREPRPGTAPLSAPPSQPVNINKASLVDLETLPGVGFILAQNILTYRDAFGPYKDIDDLVRVPGITPGILAEIREFLSVPPEQQPKEIEPELLDEAQASLLVARNKLAEGDVEGTVAQYSKLVKNPELLPEIIRDLKEALYRFPVDMGLWQTLGDAYMRSDQLAEALEAYTKAEELLR